MAIDSGKIQQLESGIDDSFGRIESGLVAEVYAEQLPIIGGQLASAVNGQQALSQLLTLKSVIDQGLQAVIATNDFTAVNIETQLDNVLVANGFETASQHVNVTLNTDDTFAIGFGLAKTTSAFSTSVDSHFGLPGLDLTTSGNATVQTDYQFNLNVGVDNTGFYLSTDGGSPEIALNLDVTTPGFSANSTLGFIKLTATDSTTDPSDLHGQFLISLSDDNHDGRLRDGESTDLAANFTGSSDINLHLAADMQSAVLPSISADMGVTWNFSNSLVNPSDSNAGFGSTPDVTFSNLEVDFGSFVENFLKPILDKIDPIFAPLQQAIAVFNTDITFLHDIPGMDLALDHAGSDVNGNDAPDGKITLIDFLKLISPATNFTNVVDFVNLADDMVHWAAFFEGKDFGPDEYNLGSLKILGDLRAQGFDITHATTQISQVAASLSDFLNGSLTGAGYDATLGDQSGQQIVQQIVLGSDGTGHHSFDFPVITDPQEAIKLLLGGNADLFSLDMPTIETQFPIPKDFVLVPAIPGLFLPGISLDLQASAGLFADLSFGYDTRGLEQFVESNYTNFGDVLNGLFVADGPGPELELQALLSLVVEAGFTIPGTGIGVEVGGGGTIAGDITLDLNDNLNGSPVDGKLYYDEFVNALHSNPFSLFDAGGLIQAGFTAFVEVFGYDVWRYNSPRITLGGFNFSDDPGPDQPPATLAQADPNNTTELQLNLGSFSGDRTLTNTPGGETDGDESFHISHGSIIVDAFGRTEHYTGYASVHADGGAGNDEIVADADVDVSLNLSGGEGNDALQGGSADDHLSGDAGRDLLSGQGGNDTLDGGDGDDVLEGGAGADVIKGGNDIDVATYEHSTVTITLDLGDAANGTTNSTGDAAGDTFQDIEIWEGTRVAGTGDTLIGTSASEKLFGLEGDDFLFGNGGDDWLYGGDGNDALQGGTGNDVLSGGKGDDIYYVDSLADTVSEDYFNPGDKGGIDRVIASINYSIANLGDIEQLQLQVGSVAVTGTGNTLDNLIIGNENDNVLSGGDGNDTIQGGLGNDTLNGEAGEDILRGEDGDDHLNGGADNDTLNGGIGNDTLDGGAGIDTATGGTGDDTYYVDNAGDVVVEHTGEGNDTVRASVDYTLASDADIETLKTADDNGTDPIKLTGNDLAQTLIGNKGDNWLEGRGGADHIDGGSGGLDTASYQHSPDAVTIDLKDASFHGGDAEGDSIANIDAIEGSDGFGDKLLGTEGDDILLYGLGGDDVLDGRGGADHLFGGEGNDRLIGGAGGDQLDGGSGIDTVDYSGAPATGLTADLTNSFNNTGEAAGDTYNSVENLIGTGGDDRLVGDTGSNKLDGGDGNDVLQGNGAGDEFVGGTGIDTASYQDSQSNGSTYNLSDLTPDPNDVLPDVSGVMAVLSDSSRNRGESAGDTYDSIENLRGGDGDDILIGDMGVNELDGGAGNDTLQGAAGADHLIGGADGHVNPTANALNKGIGGLGDVGSYDEATAGVTADLTSVDAISATANGETGDGAGDTFNGVESLIGSNFGDTLRGDSGANILLGGEGDDVLEGRGGADYLDGGADTADHTPGDNTASYEHAAAGVTADLRNNGSYFFELNNPPPGLPSVPTPLTGAGDAKGDFYNHIVNLIGSDFNDVLRGTGPDPDVVGEQNYTGANTLDGGKGDDILIGGYGADHLIGGEGNDTAKYFDSSDNSAFDSNDGKPGIVADLADSSQNKGDTAIGDTYAGVENLYGTKYSDLLIGDAGNNVLTGDDGVGLGFGDPGFILGDNGDDMLVGGAGADTLIGGAGHDTASYFSAATGVTANLASPSGNTGDAQGDTYSSIENLTGSSHADVLTGNSGSNVLDGGGSDDPNIGDTLIGGGGGDLFLVRNIHDVIDGSGVNGGEVDVYGTADGYHLGETVKPAIIRLMDGVTSFTSNDQNNSLIQANNGGDTIDGGGGDDNIVGGTGGDSLIGGIGNDRLEGGGGADHFDGGAGSADIVTYSTSSVGLTIDMKNDAANSKGGTGDAAGDTFVNIETVQGTSHDDTIRGDDNANTLLGGAGNDTLDGRDGDDVLDGGAGADHFIGGANSFLGDTVSYSSAGSVGVTADLLNPNVNTGDAAGDTYDGIESLNGSFLADTLRGDNNINILYGGVGDDHLEGRGGADELYGYGTGFNGSEVGNDFLDGGSGDDYLQGGRGNDTVIGGAGNDAMWGDASGGSSGSDTDTFVYDGQGHDFIEDFEVAGTGHDIIKIVGTFANFNALKAAITQDDTRAVITFDANDSLTLVGVDKASLSSADFVFVPVAPPTITLATATPGSGVVGIGRPVRIDLTASDALTVTGTGLTLKLNDGGAATYDSLNSDPADNMLEFIYTPKIGENIGDLKISSLVLGSGTTVKDAAGKALILTSVANKDLSISVDTIAPAVTAKLASDTGVLATDKLTNVVALSGGGDKNATVSFTVDSVPVLDTKTGNASTGAWSYTPTGLADGMHTIVASETDAAGNTGFASLAFTLDTTAPAPLATNVSSVPGSGGRIGTGGTVFITLDLGEAVTVTGKPTLALSNGGVASYVAASSHLTSGQVAFSYKVAAGQDTGDLTVDHVVIPSGASVKDAAGNIAVYTGVAGADLDLTVDTTAPNITTVTGSPASSMRVPLSDTITIDLTTSEAVNVIGAPTLKLSDGGVATYDATHSNATMLEFDYVTKAGQNTTDLKVTSLTLPSGSSIKDTAGNAVVVTGAANKDLGIIVDTTLPTVKSITATPSHSGPLVNGDTETFTLHTSEQINVGAGVMLALNDGAHASYVSGTGTDTIVFTYVVGTESSADLKVLGIDQSGSGFTDLAGNAITAAVTLDTKTAVNAYTWKGGAGDFDDPTHVHWTQGSVPPDGAAAQITAAGTYIVTVTNDHDLGSLTTAKTVTVNVDTAMFTIHGTDTGANAGKISVIGDGNGTTLDMAGVFKNTGAITIDDTAALATLTVIDDLTLSGGGKVSFLSNVALNNRIVVDGHDLTNVDNTISGAGHIQGNGNFFNQAKGIVSGGSPLTIEGDNGTDVLHVTNAGTMASIGPGGLVFLSTAVTNSHVIQASGSSANVYFLMSTLDNTSTGSITASGANAKVVFDGTTVSGGTLKTVGATAFMRVTENGAVATTFDGTAGHTVNVAGVVNVDDGAALNLEGAVKNTGTITVDTALGSLATDLIIIADTTLSGGGTIKLTNDLAGVISDGSGHMLTNGDTTAANTISGVGTFGDDHLTIGNSTKGIVNANDAGGGVLHIDALAFSNAGLLEATGHGVLEIDSDIANLASGLVKAAAGAHVDLDDAMISGGKVSTVAGSSLDSIGGSSTISTTSALVNAGRLGAEQGDLTVTGGVTNSGALDANGHILDIAGNVTGAGTATIENGGTLEFGDASSAKVTFGAGSGTLILDQATTAAHKFTGKITGFDSGDHIVLGAVGFVTNDGSQLVYNSTTHVLTIHDNAGHTETLTFAAAVIGDFHVQEYVDPHTVHTGHIDLFLS